MSLMNALEMLPFTSVNCYPCGLFHSRGGPCPKCGRDNDFKEETAAPPSALLKALSGNAAALAELRVLLGSPAEQRGCAQLLIDEMSTKRALAGAIRCDQLELSVRTAYALEKTQLGTVAELIALTESEALRSIPLGRKSLYELREVLGELGLSFRA
jgi:hypothetical protein